MAYGVIVPDEHVRGESASLHAAHSNVQKANVCIAAEHATLHHPSPKWSNSVGTHQHGQKTQSAPFAWHPLQHHAVSQRFPESPCFLQNFCTLGRCAPARASSWQKELAEHEAAQSHPGQESRLVADIGGGNHHANHGEENHEFQARFKIGQDWLNASDSRQNAFGETNLPHTHQRPWAQAGRRWNTRLVVCTM